MRTLQRNARKDAKGVSGGGYNGVSGMNALRYISHNSLCVGQALRRLRGQPGHALAGAPPSFGAWETPFSIAPARMV